LPRARACSGILAHDGHFMPTGVSRMQSVQIGDPQTEQDTRVAVRGWLTQVCAVCGISPGYPGKL